MLSILDIGLKNKTNLIPFYRIILFEVFNKKFTNFRLTHTRVGVKIIGYIILTDLHTLNKCVRGIYFYVCFAFSSLNH